MTEQDLKSLTVKIDLMADTLEDLDGRIARLDDAIRGNGRTGVITRLAVLDRRVDSSEAFINEFRSIRRWVLLGIAAMLGTLMWSVIEWYVASNP